MASSPKRPKKKTLILIFAAVLIIALLAILYFALKDTEAFKIFESTQALQEYVSGFGACCCKLRRSSSPRFPAT